MNLLKIKKTFLAYSVLLAILVGCSTPTENNNNLITPDNDQFNLPNELTFNYKLLSIYYFYASQNQEISDNPRDYYQAPLQENYGNSWCTIDYTDICYMYNKMSDPFTRYFDPYYTPHILKILSESDEVVGIGTETEFKDSCLVVTDVYEKSPAAKAGISEKDTIVSIRGTVPGNMEAAEILLKGSEGDKIDIVIKRGDETKTVTVTLETYNTPTVRVTYEDSIPVIQIKEFTSKTVSDSGTYGEFNYALRKTERAKSTIIDLRKNPGGNVTQCISIAAELLDVNDTILKFIETGIDSILKGKNYDYIQSFDTNSYVATREGLGKDRYYVFLADSGSASCAEALLAAITNNKKSPVVGLTSYGKGIVQKGFPTPAGGLALITHMQFIDNNGETYHKYGIAPDFESSDSDEQMAKAVELAKEGKYIRTAGYGSEITGHFAKALAKKQPNNQISNRKELLREIGPYHIK